MTERELIAGIQADLDEEGLPYVSAKFIEMILASAARRIIEGLGEGARVELPGPVSLQVRVFREPDERVN